MRPLPPIPIGTSVGQLTVIRPSDTRSAKGECQYDCRCVCGQIVQQTASALKRQNAHSCGCTAKQRQREGKLVHGHAKQRGVHGPTSEYGVWQNMRARCLRPETKGFGNYGGRGITVCEEWREDFTVFLRDMGPRPGRGYSIERRDNDGPYSPDNCYWATKAEQMLNRRCTLWIIENGRRLPAKTWAEREHVRYMTMRGIFYRLGLRVLRLQELPCS